MGVRKRFAYSSRHRAWNSWKYGVNVCISPKILIYCPKKAKLKIWNFVVGRNVTCYMVNYNIKVNPLVAILSYVDVYGKFLWSREKELDSDSEKCFEFRQISWKWECNFHNFILTQFKMFKLFYGELWNLTQQCELSRMIGIKNLLFTFLYDPQNGAYWFSAF